MATHYCYSDAAAGGDGTIGTPWNSLTTAFAQLKILYGSGTAAAGSKLIIRGTFTGAFKLESIKGTAASPFTIEGDSGYGRAVVDGNYYYPTEQTTITFNWYRKNSPTGPLAGSGWGIPWFAGLIRLVSCEHVVIKHVKVCNSMSIGISGMKGGHLDDCEIGYTILGPVQVDQAAGYDWYAQDCHIHHYSLINYKGAQSIVYPIIGGIVLSGENGAASANISKYSLTFTGQRKLINCLIHNTGGEGVNIFTADGVEVIGCTVYDTFSVGLYATNVRNTVIRDNTVYLTDNPEWWDYPRYTVLPAADLVYPGFPVGRFAWTSNPPAGSYALADPHLTGGNPQALSGIVIGTEFANAPAGSDTHIYNNKLYRRRLGEYFVGSGTTFGHPWDDSAKTNANVRIEHNTFIDAPGCCGIQLHASLLHPGGQMRNNVFDQLPTDRNPVIKTTEFARSGNVYRLSPDAQYLGASDVVRDPLLTRGVSISDAFFTPRAGSGAINAGVEIVDVTTDALGVSRDSTPTAGAIEYVEPVSNDVEITEKYASSVWEVFVEGEATADDLAVAEIEMSTTIGGANIISTGTLTTTTNVTNSANVIDADDGTVATTTSSAIFRVTFATTQTIAEVRMTYPASYGAGQTGPVRIAVLATHPSHSGRIPMAERVGIVPTAGQTITIPVNARLGQVRGLRRRAALAPSVPVALFVGVMASQMLPYSLDLAQAQGVNNVMSFGAVGNGVTDDTAAIMAAIAPFTGATPNSLLGPFTSGSIPDPTQNWRQNRVIYLPPGTYLVSDTLSRMIDDAVAGYLRAANSSAIPAAGRRINGLIIRGAGVNKTIIKLKDGSSGFQDSNSPKPVVLFASNPSASVMSGLLNSDATKQAGVTDAQVLSGAINGPHDLMRGEGVDGYDNWISDLTIDVGDNQGADAIWGLFNNGRGTENLRLTSKYTTFGTAIDLTSNSNGPDYHNNIEILGFQYGIKLDESKYNTTFENVWMFGQGGACVYNVDHMAVLRKCTLRPVDSGVALINENAVALTVVRDSTADMSNATASEPISNTGYLNVNMRVVGRTTALGQSIGDGNALDGVFDTSNARTGAADVGWLAGEDEPTWNPGNDEAGIGYLTGVDITGVDSINTALTALMADTSKHTIVLPSGKLKMSAAVTVPDHIRCIDGNFSYISQNWTNFVTANNTSPLILKNFYHNTNNTTQDAVTHNGSQPLVVRNTVGTYWVNRSASAGKLFLTNLGQSRFKAYGTAPVFLRQFNTEGGGTRCTVYDGADTWALSTKSEQNCTTIEQIGGTLQVLGHFTYPSAACTVPAFKVTDARLYLVLAEDGHTVGNVYTDYVGQTDGGVTTNIAASTFTARGSIGHMVPKYTVDLR